MKKVLCRLLCSFLLLSLLPLANTHQRYASAEAAHIVQIAAGFGHSLALFSDGSLYAWGSNDDGQLGDGTNIDRDKPVKIGSDFTSIAAESRHSLALKGADLYAWGSNHAWELGDGTNIDRNKPVKIGSGFTSIAAGSFYSLALKGTDLYTWGSNYGGQLGDGTNLARNKPVKIGSGFTSIAAGGGHSLALKGTDLYAWGSNYDGQLGDGTNIYRKKPVKIGSGFTSIAAGSFYSFALKGTDLYTWGYNYHGQLGDGTNIVREEPVKIGSGFTSIAAGGGHSLALKGTDLYAWGNNYDGQLGDGTNLDRNKPVKIGSGFTAIAVGGWHSIALKGGVLYAWGSNNDGELGDGTNTNRTTPVAVQFERQNSTTELRFSVDAIEMKVGDELPLAVGFYRNGQSVQVETSVKWSSSQTDIATADVLSDNTLYYMALVKGIQVGTCTITATAMDPDTGKELIATVPVKVKDGSPSGIKPTKIKIALPYTVLFVGDRFPLPIVFTPANTTLTAVDWKGLGNIIEIQDGTMYLRSAGSATVTVTSRYDKKVKAKKKIVIIDPRKESVTLSGDRDSEFKGSYQFYQVTVPNKTNMVITNTGDITVKKNLTVKKGGTLTVQGQLKVLGTLTINDGAQLNLHGTHASISANKFVINSSNLEITGGTIKANRMEANTKGSNAMPVYLGEKPAGAITITEEGYSTDKNRALREARIKEALLSEAFSGFVISDKIDAKFEFKKGQVLRKEKDFGYEIKVLASTGASVGGPSAVWYRVQYAEGDKKWTYQCTKLSSRTIETFLADVNASLKQMFSDNVKTTLKSIIFDDSNYMILVGRLPKGLRNVALTYKEMRGYYKGLKQDMLTLKKLLEPIV